MPIKYTLYAYALSDNDNDRRARIRHTGVSTMDDVLQEMLERGSTVSRADALAVVELYHEVILYLLGQGQRVRTPLVYYALTVSGLFDGDHDRFDRARHRFRVTSKAGPLLKQLQTDLTREARVEKVRAELPSPSVVAVQDLESGARSERLTPGGYLRIRGYRLKHAPDDPGQGVFFSPEGGGDDAVLRSPELIINEPKELLVRIPPALPAGACTLEVAARPRHNQSTLRRGRLQQTLEVLPPDAEDETGPAAPG